MRRVGRYEILRVVGRGGMATVYLARQRDLDREVALKELTLSTGPEPGVARRFLREARLAGSFSHPNIVTVHDYFERGGAPYIAMEYLACGALRPYVGRLSLEQVGGVLEDLLAGLAHAAERGVVHRDLKPENLMVTAQGRTKIADFGIAKATSAAAQTTNLTTAGSTLGTPRYMAPERALGQEVGPWSDLYAVGVIAFELLVGHTPFHDTEEPMAVLMRQINDPIPRVDTLIPDVDSALADWIAHLVVKSPEDRTPTAQAALDELDEVLIDRLGARWTRRAPLPARPGDPTTSVPLAEVRRASGTGAASGGPARESAAAGADAASGRARSGRAKRLAGGAAAAAALGRAGRESSGSTANPESGGAQRGAAGGGAAAAGSGRGAGGGAAAAGSGRGAGGGAAGAAGRVAAGAAFGGAARGGAAGAGFGGAAGGGSSGAFDDGALTVAPATLAVPRARRGGRRRWLLALAALVAVTVLAGRVLGGGAGTPGSPLNDVAPRKADLRSANSPAERADAANALAREYEQGAADDPRYERVADAYRRAAKAVRREDGSDYDDAIADARAGERAIARARRSGIGDSQSDDPSDDEPDGGED